MALECLLVVLCFGLVALCELLEVGLCLVVVGHGVQYGVGVDVAELDGALCHGCCADECGADECDGAVCAHVVLEGLVCAAKIRILGGIGVMGVGILGMMGLMGLMSARHNRHDGHIRHNG